MCVSVCMNEGYSWLYECICMNKWLCECVCTYVYLFMNKPVYECVCMHKSIYVWMYVYLYIWKELDAEALEQHTQLVQPNTRRQLGIHREWEQERYINVF